MSMSNYCELKCVDHDETCMCINRGRSALAEFWAGRKAYIAAWEVDTDFVEISIVVLGRHADMAWVKRHADCAVKVIDEEQRCMSPLDQDHPDACPEHNRENLLP